MLVTSTNNRLRRRVAAGAVAVAAVAAPFVSSALVTAAPDLQAAPCLAWFGNKEDGRCLGYSTGNGVNVGTPEIGIYGPNGPGFSTGPLLPGTTITEGIN
ncbi:hypothetical protein H7I95_11595 [Mycolicibacterium elephantis]|uniref:Uncharacterized protein n=1 Tax=Mycolicibacterium elephantis DSM 44368 TaxID=1335622 RepID=A0A439E0N8_9MYCO|nr:hypothetical protein [Mycolicibacterium elephantis]MCV7221548.1 hypothetical protein [Mycolicibacterium elephantis]RWA23986.1 hypothetical protein MELE44368_01895 [Mycolicibacterium elephantis DSM 44368]